MSDRRPPRLLARGLCLVGLLGVGGVLGTALSGCASSEPSSSGPATTAFGSNVTRAAAPVSTVADITGLARYVPTVAGLTPASGVDVDRGPFDLNGAVRKYNSNDAEARRRLSDAGFVGGHTATFTGESGISAGVQVYEFKDPAGAADFADYVKEHAMQGVQNFNVNVAGVPGVTGFVQRQAPRAPGQPAQGTLGGALFVKGPYLAYLGASASSSDVTGVVTSLAQAQYQALP